MRLDKTGVLMMLALFFAAKCMWHLFAAGVCFIVYELSALLVNAHHLAVNMYNERR